MSGTNEGDSKKVNEIKQHSLAAILNRSRKGDGNEVQSDVEEKDKEVNVNNKDETEDSCKKSLGSIIGTSELDI